MLFNLKIIIIFITIAFTGCGSEFETLLDGKTATRNYTFSWNEFSGIYWSEADGTIHRINFDGTGEEVLRVSSNIPLDIAIDTNNSRIFWTEYTGSAYRICRGGFNEDDTVVVHTSSYGPTAIAIDNSAGFIYWNDNSSRDIYRSAISSDTLAGTEWFSDFANDHVYSACVGNNGRVYFTVNSYYSNSAALGSGNGGDVYWGATNSFDSDIQVTSLTGPAADSCPFKGIAVNVAGGHVFFVTYTSNGARPKTVTRTNLSLSGTAEWIYLGPSDTSDIHKIALDLVNRKIYWTSQTDNRLYRADMDTQYPAIEPFLSLDSMPTGICISQ